MRESDAQGFLSAQAMGVFSQTSITIVSCLYHDLVIPEEASLHSKFINNNYITISCMQTLKLCINWSERVCDETESRDCKKEATCGGGRPHIADVRRGQERPCLCSFRGMPGSC